MSRPRSPGRAAARAVPHPASARSAGPARAAAPSSGAEPERAGFVLYVGLQGDGPGLDAAHAADLADVAEALRDLARDLLPAAETYTALSLAPGGGDVASLRARLAALRPLEPRSVDPGPVAESA